MQRIDKNFVIQNKALKKNIDLLPSLFGEEDLIFIEEGVDMYDILILAGLHQTRTQAKNAWKKEKEIPEGFTHFRNIGKLNHSIAVYKPI